MLSFLSCTGGLAWLLAVPVELLSTGKESRRDERGRPAGFVELLSTGALVAAGRSSEIEEKMRKKKGGEERDAGDRRGKEERGSPVGWSERRGRDKRLCSFWKG
uniref:Secreted protein n=1 Tax=Spongospora subterranea TaxID=70186 RepID=A0A0H5QLE1_9EUKA|eukprot:CRZ02176.1 hypothetical protein [Spongospora subterranea]